MTLPQLIALLGAVRVQQAMQGAALAIAAEVHNRIAPYPPAGPGNQPRAWQSSAGGVRVNNSWYVRGTGSFWITKNGTIHQRNNSETLGRKWAIQARPAGAVVGNSASYAPFVVAAKKQTPAMARIGWTTDRAAVQAVRESGVVQEILAKALAAAFRSRGV